MTSIIREPFIAAFTGQLSTFTSVETKKTYTFTKPYPRIVKNHAYMMEVDVVQNRIRMLPVIG